MEHGGFYAAQAGGFYAAEGLEVAILKGGPESPVVVEVGTGRVPFGVANADAILIGCARGADLVATMAPLQKSPRCLLSHQESGITHFEQIRAVTLAINAGDPFAVFLQARLPLPGVRVVPYFGDVSLFLKNKDYMQQGYVFSEPIVARAKGANVNTLLLADLGFSPYGSCLFTTSKLATEEVELVRKMTRASVRGWQEYLRDPKPAHALIKSVNPDMTEEALQAGFAALQPLCFPEGLPATAVGTMNAERWQALHQQMSELKLGTMSDFTQRPGYQLDFLEIAVESQAGR